MRFLDSLRIVTTRDPGLNQGRLQSLWKVRYGGLSWGGVHNLDDSPILAELNQLSYRRMRCFQYTVGLTDPPMIDIILSIGDLWCLYAGNFSGVDRTREKGRNNA